MQDVMMPKRIETGIIDLNQRALKIRITDDVAYHEAGALFVFINDMAREIENFFEPLVKKAYDTHKALTNARKAELDKLLPAKNALNKEMIAYRAELKRKADEEEVRLREEAKQKAEEDRLMAALEAEADGDKMTAEAILDETVIVEPVKSIETPKPQGVQFRTTWDFEIIAPSLIPREYLIPDTVAIRKVVNALKDKANIPGVRIFSVTSVGRGR
ncbi:MAG: hypothetical protein ACOYWZ_22365 [Bacillota bacterium]